MALDSGSRLGPYEVLAALGAGGMGEVYRARDTKLNRDVALKVLPTAFAQDADRLARFQREAQVLASLNHPNIATIHGLEESGGIRALVMELVEGPTLAARIAEGPLPLDEALRMARQMAEAIEAAHDKGVVHRDLKPANVKLTGGGAVKVLDFGLAKAMADDDPSGSVQDSPTLSLAATKAGVILGTAAYMSPEQAKGEPADRRADIWAFGVVLLEMLTGQRVYAAETAAETLALVMMKEPALDTLPPGVPPAIRKLLRRCLEKDPRRRLQAIGEARIVIEEALSGAPAETSGPLVAPVPAARPGVWKAATAALGVLFLASLTVVIGHFRETPPKATTVRFFLPPPENTTLGQADYPVVSPNGEYVVFADRTSQSHSGMLRVRRLGSLTIESVPGTEGAFFPFWSPDSRSIGFYAAGKLKKVEVSGGTPQTVCDTGTAKVGAWGPDGTIIFSGFQTGPLLRVAAAGGEPKPWTALDPARQEIQHARPSFLPDGRHFLYLAVSSLPDKSGIYVGSLDWKDPKDSKDAQRLITGASNAVYAASPGGGGYLLFERGGALMAQSFDSKTLQLAGDPFPIVEQVAPNPYGGSSFSVSENGVLAYRVGSVAASTQLEWFDRSGKRLEAVGDPGDYTNLALSPDEKKVAVGRRDPATKTRDLWIYDLVRGTASRLTFDPGDDLNPAWSPDGTRIAFTSDRKGQRNIYQKMASGTGDDQLLLESGDRKNVEDWSRDGRFLIYNVGDGSQGVWMLPLSGDGKPAPLIPAPFNKAQAQLSPNGRWIAYRSNESGRGEVYVQSFPPSGGKWQVSTSGGGEPAWRRDGKELFYVSNRRFFAVAVKTEGSAFEAGIPAVLFEAPVAGVGRNTYVVAANGQRFLVITTVEERTTPAFTVVLNWAAGLKR